MNNIVYHARRCSTSSTQKSLKDFKSTFMNSPREAGHKEHQLLFSTVVYPLPGASFTTLLLP